MNDYKIVIIGCGPGGYVAAIRAAQLGAKVCVIEQDEVGGTCLNRGCIPTKTLIATTQLLDKLHQADELGIEIQGIVRPNYAKMLARKNKVVAINVGGIKSLFKSYQIELIKGTGKLLNPHQIQITLPDGTITQITTDNIIIATGSRPADLPNLTLDGNNIISSDIALNFSGLPKSMLIVGAGVIGCEFAFLFQTLGVQITAVELMPRPLPNEDEEISQLIERQFQKRKIPLFTATQVSTFTKLENGLLRVQLSNGITIEVEKILVSVGRKVNVDNLGLAELGIQQNEKGAIIVNDKMETNIPGIYAIGDVIGKLMLAHIASREGIVAAENAIGGHRTMDYRVTPWGIFTNPEIGRVGLTEKEAIEQGYQVKIGRFPLRALGKAHAVNEIDGLVKIIADATSDKILGVHICSAHATELIHETALAMQLNATATDLSRLIHTHPTFAEAISESAHDVHNQAIHLPKK
ncbi:MAG: dihydrolipoyl dehydrogenase [bacterium]|nr:dihydrolipoyl dehydrogenase [bacterium]